MRMVLLVVLVLLTGCGDSYLKTAVKDLRDSAADKRWSAAELLVNNNAAQFIPEIAAVLKDDLPEIKINAIQCLARIKDPRAIPYLLSMEEDADLNVRREAVHGLSLFEREGVKALTELMSPGHKPDVRAAAAWIMAFTGEPGIYEPLEALLLKETAPEEARAGAARGLGCLNDPRVKPLLIRVLDDQRNGPVVRCSAAFGLVGNFMFTQDKSCMQNLGRIVATESTPQMQWCARLANDELYEPTNLAGYCKPESFNFNQLRRSPKRDF